MRHARFRLTPAEQLFGFLPQGPLAAVGRLNVDNLSLPVNPENRGYGPPNAILGGHVTGVE